MYLRICSKYNGSDETLVGTNSHTDVHLIVLSYVIICPAGIYFRNFAHGCSTGLDQEIIHSEFVLSLSQFIELLPKTTYNKNDPK